MKKVQIWIIGALLSTLFFSIEVSEANLVSPSQGNVTINIDIRIGFGNSQSEKPQRTGRTAVNQVGEEVSRTRLPKPERDPIGDSGSRKTNGSRRRKRKKKQQDEQVKKVCKSMSPGIEKITKVQARKKRHRKRMNGLNGDPSGVLKTITQKVGCGPILKHYIDRMKVIEIIDRMIPGHPERKVSHGEMAAGLMMYLLNGGRAMYRMEKWAEDTAILKMIFPQYTPGDWTDDRIDDTLDAIYKSSMESVQGAISGGIVMEFSVNLNEIHYDTTSVSMWGTYDSGTGQPAVLITFGFNKDHRHDLKQIVMGMAVSGDGGVPLISGTHDGNTSDSVLPVSYWERLRNLAGKSSFCFIGDCKIASQDTIKAICAQNGLFLAPLPMTEAEQKRLIKKIKEKQMRFTSVYQKTENEMRPVYEKRTDRPGNRRKKGEASEDDDSYEVCEESYEITDNKGKRHTIRKLVIRSNQLARLHNHTRKRHLEKAEAELQKLRKRLNKRKLITREAIESAVKEILSSRKVKGLLGYEISEHTELIKKQIGQGRPGPQTQYEEYKNVVFDVDNVKRNQQAIEEESLLDGIFLMVSNHNSQQWTPSDLLALYKRQYKVERGFRVLKGPLAVSPMLLEKPNRICAMMFLMTLTLQLYTLIQRDAAREIQRRNFPLDGLMPNKIKTWRPQTDELMAAFNNVDLVESVHHETSYFHITTLSPLQMEILQLLNVPAKKYSINAYSGKSGET